MYNKILQKSMSLIIFCLGLFISIVGLIATTLIGNKITNLITLNALIINILSFGIFYPRGMYTCYNKFAILCMGFLIFPLMLWYSNFPLKAILYGFVLPCMYGISIIKVRKLIYPFLNMLLISFLISLKLDLHSAVIFCVVFSFQITFISFFSIRIYKYFVELENMNDVLRDLARKEPLTKLYNRYGLSEKIDRTKRYFAIMLDIDNFKKINDNFGHDTGDNILISIACILLKYSNSNFISSRRGGEEFLILSSFSYTDTENIIKKIFKEIREIKLPDKTNVTVSGGMSKIDFIYSIDKTSIITEADDNLYIAKNNGKNQLIYNGIDIS